MLKRQTDFGLDRICYAVALRMSHSHIRMLMNANPFLLPILMTTGGLDEYIENDEYDEEDHYAFFFQKYCQWREKSDNGILHHNTSRYSFFGSQIKTRWSTY